VSEADEGLLERCRTGDRAAWNMLIGRHMGRVFGLAYRFTGRVDEAEDLTQDVFVKVFQRLGQFDGPETLFPAWLLTLARHLALDRLRREKARPSSEPDLLESLPSRTPGPDRKLEEIESAGIVRNGLRRLPVVLREAVILRDLEGLSYEEAAEIAGVPVGTVKSRVNRGRIELARRLEGTR
jgi:RNA polymerase sigma-70 factor (ECF subfamily)